MMWSSNNKLLSSTETCISLTSTVSDKDAAFDHFCDWKTSRRTNIWVISGLNKLKLQQQFPCIPPRVVIRAEFLVVICSFCRTMCLFKDVVRWPCCVYTQSESRNLLVTRWNDKWTLLFTRVSQRFSTLNSTFSHRAADSGQSSSLKRFLLTAAFSPQSCCSSQEIMKPTNIFLFAVRIHEWSGLYEVSYRHVMQEQFILLEVMSTRVNIIN